MTEISRRSLLPLLGGVITAPAVFARSAEQRRYTYREIHMGMVARITLYADHEGDARTAARAAFDVIAATDNALSHFDRRSEISLLCKAGPDYPQRVSEHLYKNLRLADEMTRLTEGLFDSSIGPLTKLWRDSRRANILPSREEIETARVKTGWAGALSLEGNNEVQLHRGGVQFDFGGLGKGYAAGRAAEMLGDHGIAAALVEIGGDIVVTGAPPEATGWRVSLRLAGREKVVTLSHAAISTTGDSEQFMDKQGVRYSHIITPENGIALTQHRSLTVVGERGQVSDALASTLAMMDKAEGINFVRKHFRDYIVYES